jgi:hypothetical protein
LDPSKSRGALFVRDEEHVVVDGTCGHRDRPDELQDDRRVELWTEGHNDA